MNEDALQVIWSINARANLRAIERETAMQILRCLTRYLDNRFGDLKRLLPPLTGFRLRCGDYRLFFDFIRDTAIEITAVRNRRKAYR